MTTSNHKDKEMEEMYEQISSVINGKRENFIILENQNAIVGEKPEQDVTGKFGLGKRYQRSE